MMRKIALALLFFFLVSGLAIAQKQKVSFKDSLDQKLDLSDWVLTANGFIPFPSIITEPALGGFGGALFGVFVDPNPPYRDSVDGKEVLTRVKPNIYGGGAAMTVNGTWMLGAAAIGVIPKWRSNYRLVTGYADVNLEFYRSFEQLGEKKFEFNIRTIPIVGQLTKQLGKSDWYAGLNYLFLKTELGLANYEFHDEKAINTIISRPSVLIEYDGRDNIFTPDRGVHWITMIGNSAEWLGSDYSYGLVSTTAFYWLPVTPTLISGFRAEVQNLWGDAPFYMLPFVNLRGIPVARYQGNTIATAETEWRWDFSPRFSAVGFVGTGKGVMKEESWKDDSWKTSAGAGARYLIARKLKLRMGIDVARGPEEWAYFFVFGTSWRK
ncbi:BamA/TamA family outer membrane protein [Algoriphagus jejuensis]|uniref:BamA/TamA family outer membrane protein n=2 Tax=Algoriphagus jejuensis TaxID=419934 RepID=A0ABP3Y7Q3_9BACT